ncbi:TPA: hypothetical protein DCX16_00670, partial [bacterium]|nr:hypothetical protein [bacterium]
PNSIDNAKPGDIITLNILISDARNVFCGEIHLTYDKELLEPTENKLHKGNFLPDNAYILKNNIGNGKIDYAFGLMKPETSDLGILGTIEFIVKKQGKTNISFDFDNNSNRNTMFIERTSTGDQLPNVEQEPIEIDAPVIPKVSILLQSFPNPANNSCWIPFKLAEDAYVSLTIYNILGQKVKTIEVGQRKRGSYTKAKEGSAIFWDLKNDSGQRVSTGLYYYKLKLGKFSQTKSMVVGK